MGRLIEFSITESAAELKTLQKKYPSKYKAIQMLLLIKKHGPLTKMQLASSVLASDRSIHSWRANYIKGGIAAMLKDTRGGKKVAAITPRAHQALSERLNDPKGGFKTFIEIQHWLAENFGIAMNYHAVNKYVKRKFGARPKVPRKSHVHKSPADEAVFKTPAWGVRTY